MPFGAGCIGLTALGTSYVAGIDGWWLSALPVLGISAYYLLFEEGMLDRD
jgi:hypothetical protein